MKLNKQIFTQFLYGKRSKQDLVNAIRDCLQNEGYPRLHVMLIVLLCFGISFLSSFVLFKVGIFLMWVRYLLSMSLAYAVFLVLIWYWARKILNTQEENQRIKERDNEGWSDLNVFPSSENQSPDDAFASGGGGEAAGGGAGNLWDVPVNSDIRGVSDALPDVSIDVDIDVGEAGIVILPVVIIGVLIVSFSVVSVIYSAPILLAEVIVDVFLASMTAKFLEQRKRKYWLETAFKKTIIPFLVTLSVVVGVAFWLGYLFPNLHTIGQLIH